MALVEIKKNITLSGPVVPSNLASYLPQFFQRLVLLFIADSDCFILGPHLFIVDFFYVLDLSHLFEVLFHSQSPFIGRQLRHILLHSLAVLHDLVGEVTLDNLHFVFAPKAVIQARLQIFVPLHQDVLASVFEIDFFQAILDIKDLFFRESVDSLP